MRRSRLWAAVIVALFGVIAFGVLPSTASPAREALRTQESAASPLQVAAVQPEQASALVSTDAQPSATKQDSASTFAQLPAETQQGIASAMRAAQAIPDSTDLFFKNPSQSLSAIIGAAGSTVRGRDGADVRFSHPELGRSDQFVAMTDARPSGVTTQRITIERQAAGIAVSEWWNNSAAGVEQGFTVSARPAGAGALEVRQTWGSALSAEVSADGDAFILSDAAGERMRYAGLKAWDATGRTLPAQMQVSGHTLAMVVDDADAVFPIVIDPTWAQQAYLKASNTGGGNPGMMTPGDVFGYSVAISGDTIVVGAFREDSNGTGVNGGAQADNSAGDAGAAYVFLRTGTTWAQQAYLKASNTETGDVFGYSVAISGDTIVVGARNESSNGTGVNGGAQADNNAPNSGAAYVFLRTGATWAQQAYLKASNTGADDQFGQSVAIASDTIVVGAVSEDSNGTGVNGGAQADNNALNSGAAYVFLRTGTTWAQQAYLKASNTEVSDWFGYSVAIASDTIVVGAIQEASNGTGVNGGAQADNSAGDAGAAYVFLRTGATWAQQAYLKASNTGASDYFGISVAIAGDTIVVGAQTEDSNGTGVNGGAQADNNAGDAGAAYVFLRTGATWAQQAYLKASNTGAGDNFGSSVAIAGDTIVVGAVQEASNGTGVNGGAQADNSAGNSGAAYVFLRTGTAWAQQAYLKASNTGASDNFGISVAIAGDTIVVGAHREDSNGTGVNGGAQADNTAADSGAAYVFLLPAAPTVTSVAASSGVLAGGTAVTITGTGFTATPTVTFGGTAATNVTFVNATTITATTPAKTAGAVNIVVTNPDAQTGTGAGLYTYVAAPTVTSVAASSGPAAGGTVVTITGTGFTATPTVTFGGTAATNVTFVNATTITATTPAKTAGAVNIVVTNPDAQTGTGAGLYTYVAAPAAAVPNCCANLATPQVFTASLDGSRAIRTLAPNSAALTAGESTVVRGNVVNTTTAGNEDYGSDAIITVPAGAVSGGTSVVLQSLESVRDLAATAPLTGGRLIAALSTQMLDTAKQPITTNFTKAVTISITLPVAALSGVDTAGLQLIYWSGTEWVVVPAVVKANADGSVTVSADVTHFTVYAVSVKSAAPVTPAKPIPVSGGFGLFVFGGGSAEQLVAASGCPTVSSAFWATVNGTFVPFIPGTAITAVNAAFNAAFPNGIPAGTPLIGRCV